MAAKTMLDLSMEGKDVTALNGTELMLVEQYNAGLDAYVSRPALLSLVKAWMISGLATNAVNNLINKFASYDLQLSDFQNGSVLYDKVYLRMDVATDNNVTIGTALSSLPNLSEISVRNVNIGFTTLVASGTTLNGILVFNTANEVKTLIKVGANEWDVVGALT